MATSMPSMQDQQSAGPSASGATAAPPQGTPPSQGQATDLQRLLASWINVAKQMSAAEPRVAAAMEKVVQALGEAQTALVTPPQPTPMNQQPQY